MKNICTLSDRKYLLQGMALLDSLESHSSDFTLHYLALDSETKDGLNKLENSNIQIYSIDDFFSDSHLLNLRNTNYSYFCWTLASYFSNYLLHKHDSILYCDSDIYFFQDIQTIYDSISNKDVGIFKHRQFTYEENRVEGAFNVGVVYFKNSNVGKLVSDWWKDAVLHKKYPHLATCGDQKYLDEFPKMCTSEEIFIDGNVGHGSPWEWQLYKYDNFLSDGTISWNGKIEKLVFSHFSQFHCNPVENTYIPSKDHYSYTGLGEYRYNSVLNKIYDDYFEVIKKQFNKLYI